MERNGRHDMGHRYPVRRGKTLRLSESAAKKIESRWRLSFKEARSIRCAEGVVTVTHLICNDIPRIAEGKFTRTPLLDHGTYSVELVEGAFFSMYEAVIPDLRLGRQFQFTTLVAAMAPRGAREKKWCSVKGRRSSPSKK